ncbi:DHS-like NAD/FAD-binding domain-containing protein [Sphaerosporella brunnea]|uniref:DHS-like NAD/FAD-binding domain-containing protein n=1 Tax=Sphaerosporella brunnea TaxID=1250544 RepID=A0A5J5EM51_9PEZI|nr:DHS-like NAD/FAD-binding domain-containing protein [Sphaerosporella brunnea]
MPITTVTPDCSRQLQTIADAIARSKKSIVVTGAGISTNCGIPDFRSTNGLYNLVKAQYPNVVVKGRDLFDAVVWSDKTSTALFHTFLANLRNEVLKVNEASSVHKFIRVLADSGRLLRCYTQNIDGLEEREGLVINISHGKGKRKRPSPITKDDNRTDQEKGCQVVQLHGDLKSLRCTNCQLLTEYSPSHIATLLSGAAPTCMACEAASLSRQAAGKRATKIGLLRPNVVLYGEDHPDADMVGKLAQADIGAAPDLMVIMGTSLKVHGLKVMIKQFARAVHARGGQVLFINNTPPAESAWNDVIDIHVQMDCDAWVADVKTRRAGIWERQTKLTAPKYSKTKATAVRKKALMADKENAEARNRKVLEPKTPTKGRAKKASKVLQETPYMSPPNSAKKKKRGAMELDSSELAFKSLMEGSPIKRRKLFESNILEPSTPTKTKRKTKQSIVFESPQLSPPITPSTHGRKMIAVEITCASPEKQLHEEMKIFNDGINPAASLTPSRRSPRATAAA